jgi:hypothetical protein
MIMTSTDVIFFPAVNVKILPVLPGMQLPINPYQGETEVEQYAVALSDGSGDEIIIIGEIVEIDAFVQRLRTHVSALKRHSKAVKALNEKYGPKDS